MNTIVAERPARRVQREFVSPPPAGPTPQTPPGRDAIAQRAYEIWQRHGCPRGTEFQDWLAAEAELRCRR